MHRHSSGAGTAIPSGAPKFTSDLLWCKCCSIFSFLCRVVLDHCNFFFFLSLRCLSLRVLITHLVSSNFSYTVFVFLSWCKVENPPLFNRSVCIKTGKLEVMYKCISGIDFSVACWNYSECVFDFILNFARHILLVCPLCIVYRLLMTRLVSDH